MRFRIITTETNPYKTDTEYFEEILDEGSAETGYFVLPLPDRSVNRFYEDIEKELKQHNYGKIWYSTVAEYNEANGTNYYEG